MGWPAGRPPRYISAMRRNIAWVAYPVSVDNRGGVSRSRKCVAVGQAAWEAMDARGEPR